MTDNRLNEIKFLLNQQNAKLNQIMLAFEIALGEGFLDHKKSVIHANLSMISDSLEEVLSVSEKVVKEIENI